MSASEGAGGERNRVRLEVIGFFCECEGGFV